MRRWPLYALVLALLACTNAGLGQPGGSGRTERKGIEWFSNSATGVHDRLWWKVDLFCEIDDVTSQNYISGGNNHVRIVDMVFDSTNQGLEFKIHHLGMTIGGHEISKWAPADSQLRGHIENYHPVRFTASKFSPDEITIGVSLQFQVKRRQTSSWSDIHTLDVSKKVIIYNHALDWQTTIDYRRPYISQYGNRMWQWWSFSSQAREAGVGQRAYFYEMGQRFTMWKVDNAQYPLGPWYQSMTVFFPRTHGEYESLYDSTIGKDAYEDMRGNREVAVRDGAPRANLALLMASQTGRPMHDIMFGTPQFANFGTCGILWSLAYPDTASDEVSASPPHRPISELYIEATRQMAEGRFANEIPALSEVASGSTYTGVYAKDPESDVYWWIPRNLEFFGDGNQRLGHVYMDSEQRMNFENRNADTRLWYLVLDPNDLRGE